MEQNGQNGSQLSQPQRNLVVNRWVEWRKRLHVAPGAVAQLPEGYLWVKVISGVAWITVDHRDVIVRAQSQRELSVSGVGLVSGLLNQALVLDVFRAAASNETVEQCA